MLSAFARVDRQQYAGLQRHDEKEISPCAE